LFLLLTIFSGCSSIYDAEENRRNLTTQFSSAQLLSDEMKVEQILNGEADKQFVRPPEKASRAIRSSPTGTRQSCLLLLL